MKARTGQAGTGRTEDRTGKAEKKGRVGQVGQVGWCVKVWERGPEGSGGVSVSLRHRGGRIQKINAWYLNTHMVYL